MLTLSGAIDRVVSCPDFSLQHKNVRKLTGFVVQFFSSFYTICHLNNMLVLCGCCPLWLLSCKQQSLANSNMCYLLWSQVEFRIVFFYLNIKSLFLGPLISW